MQRIEELTDTERGWVSACIDYASQLVPVYSPDDAGRQIDVGVLDRTYAGWFATGDTDGERINAVINAIGFAFGQLLVDELGFRWAVVTDEQGCEMAVHALPGRGDILVFPAHVVAKRWQIRETGFLVPVYEVIKNNVREADASWPELPPAFRNTT